MGNRVIPVETKQAILEDAKKRILEGSTLDQIASSHGIDTKTCPKCSKSHSESTCPDCKRAITKEWREKNKARISEYNARYKAENAAEMTAYKIAYRAENVDAINAYARQYHAEHKDERSEYSKKYRAENYQLVAKREATYRATNREKTRVNASRWAKENKDKRTASQMRREAAKIQATPAWADEFVIAEAYELASMRAIATKIDWQVDHIVPLRSKLVCGLHCEFNLQLLPRSENAAKGNRHWPNMP